MRHRSRSLFATVTLALLSACGGGGGSDGGSPTSSPASVSGSQQVAPQTSTISGLVRDRSGQPVAGVTVSLFHHNEGTTVTATTDANGRFAVAGLRNGSFSEYAIYASKSGLAFYPATSDPAATIERFDFGGLYRTVIRIAALPARDISDAGFTVYRAGDKQLDLARTGQTASLVDGDDGDLQRGVAWPAQRYTDNLDGTVTDGLTGLIWLKNAGCFAAADWARSLTAANQLASGSCGLTDGSHVGQWRMPNANELESLVDVSQSIPALTVGHPFTNVQLTKAYWSSSTYNAGPSNAMAIRFTDGRWINGIDPAAPGYDNDKVNAMNALWAVRSGGTGLVKLAATGVYAGIGGRPASAGDDASLQLGVPLTSPRFIDKGDGTLADTVTGLTWLKQADCINQPWAEAVASVRRLASGQCGLSDGSAAGQWRMPNRNEMMSLSDRAPTFPQASYLNGQYQASNAITGPVIFGSFIVSAYYWTSTSYAADPGQAWTVYSCDFGVYQMPKAGVGYTMAVR